MSVSRILFSRSLFTGENIGLLRKCSSQNVFNMSDTAVQTYLKRIMLEHENLNTKTVRTPEESKRLFEIKPIINVLKHRNTLNDNIEILKKINDKQSEDEELPKNRIQEETKKYLARMTEVDRELQSILLEPQLTEGGVLLEVTAGSDRQEAMLFARELFEMYQLYAKYKDWDVCIVSLEESKIGGLKKASMFVEGVGVPELMKMEAGLHRVKKISDSENGGHIHTSTVLVAVLPKPTDKEANIPERDIVIENTSVGSADDLHSKESAVRVTHKPSGTVVECQESQSQIRNEEIAIQKMRTLLLEKQRRASQFGSSPRNEQIRTYNYPEDRVTEHREGGGTVNNLQNFMKGEYQLEHMQENLLREYKRQEFMEEISQFTDKIEINSADNN